MALQMLPFVMWVILAILKRIVTDLDSFSSQTILFHSLVHQNAVFLEERLSFMVGKMIWVLVAMREVLPVEIQDLALAVALSWRHEERGPMGGASCSEWWVIIHCYTAIQFVCLIPRIQRGAFQFL